jgi:ferredoxin
MEGAVITVTPACRGCGACLLTCPQRAIRPAAGPSRTAGPLLVLTDRCDGCGECVEVCPADAIDVTGRRADAGSGPWVGRGGRKREGEPA